jgi:hypothetical protein
MTPQFDTLFERMLLLWPSTLDVSEQKTHKSGGTAIPSLISTHDLIRESILDLVDNEFLLHMDWAIFTVLHQTAKGNTCLIPVEIDKDAVRTIYARNLEGCD